MVAGSRTIELREVHAGAAVGRALHISRRRVVLIRRLRLADGEPMALETLHVPAALVPGLTREALEDASFYDLMEERYGVVIASGQQSIEPTVTNEEESELLHVPLHSPAFLFERTSRTATGRPSSSCGRSTVATVTGSLPICPSAATVRARALAVVEPAA